MRQGRIWSRSYKSPSPPSSSSPDSSRSIFQCSVPFAVKFDVLTSHVIHVKVDVADQISCYSCQSRLTKPHVNHVKYVLLDQTSCNSCQTLRSWPNLSLVVSYLTFVTRIYVIHVKVDVLYQISCQLCQIQCFWSNVKYNFLDQTSCYSCHFPYVSSSSTLSYFSFNRIWATNYSVEYCGIPNPKPKPRFLLIPNLDRSSVWSFFGIGIPNAVRDGHSSSICHNHFFCSSKGTRDMKPYILLWFH
jgi:hypothetical protein